ncbi:MAG: DUF4058 family protein [Patescibacteria group bacterium]|nr:DUF4058 family protein [Patescibacteria group bacterium]
MAIHNWNRVNAGLFHDFHQAWTIELRNALNAGVLPPGYFALAEQILGGPTPDVVTLSSIPASDMPATSGGGIAVAEVAPRARFITSAESDLYACRANRIVVKHQLGHVVAAIEILSPGNKDSRHAIRSVVAKAGELLRCGISLLVVDLFPPTPRDPQGIHKAIWDEICEEPFELPADKPLTVASYSAGLPHTAYVEPVAVGDPLPALPIFLGPDTYVPAPLEATYQTTWDKSPAVIKQLVETTV